MSNSLRDTTPPAPPTTSGPALSERAASIPAASAAPSAQAAPAPSTPTTPERPGTFFHTLAHALMGGLMASALGPKDTNQPYVDPTTGRMGTRKVPVSTHDRIRNMVAGALQGMAAGTQAPRYSGFAGGMAMGGTAVLQRQQAEQAQARAQAQQDYQLQQNKILHDAELAHAKALTAATYYGLAKQGRADVEKWMADNKTDYSFLSRPDAGLPSGVSVRTLHGEDEMKAYSAAHPHVPIVPITPEPIIGPDGQPVMKDDGVTPQTSPVAYVLEGVAGAAGNIPLTPGMRADLKRYFGKEAAEGATLPAHEWAVTYAGLQSREKAEVQAWHNAPFDPKQFTYDDSTNTWQIHNPLLDENDPEHAWKVYTGPTTGPMQEYLKKAGKTGLIRPEILAQIGQKPTTRIFEGVDYGTPAKAEVAWGKAVEDKVNEEAAASAEARGAGYGLNRPVIVFDKQLQASTFVPAGVAEKNPQRYAAATSTQISEMYGKVATIRELDANLSRTMKLSNVVGAGGMQPNVIAAGLADPNSALGKQFQAQFIKQLTPDQQNFLYAVRNLRQGAVALKNILSSGGVTDARVDLLERELPSEATIATGDPKIVQRQLQSFMDIYQQVRGAYASYFSNMIGVPLGPGPEGTPAGTPAGAVGTVSVTHPDGTKTDYYYDANRKLLGPASEK